ncbi:MAG TPA: TonB-dependent receptor [Steroidobacteraceae bacterium]|jgi:outer membrane receptor protein involved in Fe transport|nr:TonB-dependent receptor [Steroidobacteraceae bacterium]
MTNSIRSARRSALTAAAGLLGLGAAATATAQTSTNVAALEEVVVTAQKFEQKLSETPLSVTAISARNLEALGATQFRDFANSVPSLTFTTSGVGSTQVNLRGITTGNNISPTVGIYVDEVPYGSSTPFASGAQLALDVGLFDVSRIEVLRGPQGTLYGASTMGGLLKYVSVVPDTTAFAATARAGVVSTSGGGVGYDAAAAVNAPLADDKAALRVSGFYTHDGGFIDNLTNGHDDVNEAEVYGGRADLLFKPADKLTLRVAAFAQDITRDGTAAADFGLATGEPIDGDLDQRRLRAEPFDQQFRLASGTLDYEFEGATLTSITSYQTVRSNATTDVSAFFVPALGAGGIVLGSVDVFKKNETDKFTQELRLAATGPRLDWTIGAFYTDEDSDQFQKLNASTPDGAVFPVNLLTVELPSTFEEYAGFGTLTWHATDKLDFTGGLRYAHNSQTFEQIGSGALVFSVPERDDSDSILTYLATIRYRASDNLMSYVRYATGYRPGGPNIVVNDLNGQPLASPTFGADELRSYEAGIKTTTSDGSFGVDAAVYFIKWDDLQINAVRNGLGVVANAAAAESKGAELTLTWVPVPQLALVGAFAYIDAELSEDAPDLGGLEGDRLPDTPDFTGSLAADYSFELGGREAFLGTTVRHVTDRVSSYDASAGVPQYELPEYTTVDFRTGIQLGAARLQLYLKNAFDERGQLSATTGFSALGGPAWVSLVQPRTIGLNFITQF